MTLDEQIGATLAVGIPGTEATPEVLGALRRLHAGTLVLFGRNYASTAQLSSLLRALEDALECALLVMVDHEGGRVMRFPGGATHFPDALTVAKTQHPEEVERQGAVEAQELKRLGIHVNLAPCIDVIVEGCDPVIGDRSYGSDPQRVSAFGAARIRGLQSHGVAACAKHFPGLGAVPRDPHKVLPMIQLGGEAIEAVHLVPFRAAIAEGVAAVMSSHVCYPGLGGPAGVPATFSARLIRGLLRERMGFAGAIFTDDLEMGALRAFGGIGEAAVRGAEAGHDLLLICSDLAGAEEALAALRAAYQFGRLRTRELEASVERLRTITQKFLGPTP